MDKTSLLWFGLFDQLPDEVEHRLMSKLVESGIDDSYLSLCAIHIHFLVSTYSDSHVSALTHDLQTSIARVNSLLPVLTNGLEETITKVQGLEASARFTNDVLANAAQTMAKIDDDHYFWRRLTTATPLPADKGWFLVALFSVAAGGAILANTGTILALLA